VCRCPGFAASSEILLPRRMETPDPNPEAQSSGEHRCIALLPVQLRDALSPRRKTAVRNVRDNNAARVAGPGRICFDARSPGGATQLSPALQRGVASHPLTNGNGTKSLAQGTPLGMKQDHNQTRLCPPRRVVFAPTNPCMLLIDDEIERGGIPVDRTSQTLRHGNPHTAAVAERFQGLPSNRRPDVA
jgi:hypothetical protein